MDDLLEWLSTHRLHRHTMALTDEEKLGLATLDDLRMLSDEDIKDVTSICHMNIGERNRFRAEVKRLQGKEEAPPSDAQRPAPAPAQATPPDRGAAGAQQPAQVPAPAHWTDCADHPVRGVAGAQQPAPVPAPAQAPASDRAAAGARQPSQTPAPAQAPLPDRGAAGARQPSRTPGLVRAPPRCRAGSSSPRPAAGASPRAAASPSRRQPVPVSRPQVAPDVPGQRQRELRPQQHAHSDSPQQQQKQQEEVDWYEVVNDMVVVKEAPKLQAKDLGCMRQGDRIQCKLKKFYDREGRPWLELAPSQMLASCKACRDPLAQGFALIDGTHLGLGPQLRSLPSGGAPEPRAAPAKSEDAGAVQESVAFRAAGAVQESVAPRAAAAVQQTAAPRAAAAVHQTTASRAADLSDESDEDASAAGPTKPARSFRPSPFKAQGARPGHVGGAGEEELLRQQVRQRACEESDDARKAARRGRAERMQKAQALAALKRAEEEERLGLAAPAAIDDEAFEREEAERRRRMEAQWSRDNALEALRQESEEQVRQEQTLRQRATAYRAAYDFVYAMPPGDPSAGSVRRLECQPGAAFYTTGECWQGPQGAVWLARAVAGPNGSCRELGWLMLHSPDAGEEQPWLLREEEIQGRVRVQVKYLSHLQSFRVFESCLTGRATVRALKSSLCSETGLRAGSVVLLRKEYACRSDLSEDEEGLPDHTTLAQLGMCGDVHLYLLYTSDFEEHYRRSYLLRLQQM